MKPIKPFGIFLATLFLSVQLWAQPTSLPRSTPEAEGVSSKNILDFLNATAKNNHEFHSIMVLRHGKVIAEGWWNPYRHELKHTLYSVSKSFTATAIGFAVAEKKLSVEDQVIKFFPGETPESVSPHLAALKVKHLLSMSVGQEPDPTPTCRTTENWVRAFFNVPIVHEPGTKFLYNSMASYMLSTIVQKVTGTPVLEYLTPRLFKPLGIEGADWEVDPKGVNVGGWGLRLKTEDLAKFGQLFLQKGKWEGKQLLAESWVEEATTLKIMQDPNAPQAKKDSSDWLQGYCYQMWRGRHNSYRGDGAFGQLILVLPEKDAVIIATAETSSMQKELNLIWKYLLPAFQNNPLKPDIKSQGELKNRLATLALPIPAGKPNPALETNLSGKTFTINQPDSKLKSFRLDFKKGICHLILNTDSVSHSFDFTSGKWTRGKTSKWGPYSPEKARANRSNIPTFLTETAYRWTDTHSLELTIRYIESPHTEMVRCVFDGANATIDFTGSFKAFNPDYKPLPLKALEKKQNR